jgi:hypothetical protein
MAGKKKKPLLRVVKRPGPQSTLTPKVHQELIRVHLENQDFPAATAITCGVHPKTLDKWIRKGLGEDAVEPYKAFALEFLQAETQIRADLIWDLRNADNHHEVTALTWLIGRRFKQYHHKAEEMPTDIVDILNTEGPRAGLSPDQKRFIVEQMLKDPSGPVKELLDAAGYQKVAPPQENPNGTEEDRTGLAH